MSDLEAAEEINSLFDQAGSRSRRRGYRTNVVGGRCSNGHLLDGENVVIEKKGEKRYVACRQCRKAAHRRWLKDNPQGVFCCRSGKHGGMTWRFCPGCGKPLDRVRHHR